LKGKYIKNNNNATYVIEISTTCFMATPTSSFAHLYFFSLMFILLNQNQIAKISVSTHTLRSPLSLIHPHRFGDQPGEFASKYFKIFSILVIQQYFVNKNHMTHCPPILLLILTFEVSCRARNSRIESACIPFLLGNVQLPPPYLLFST